MAERRVYANLAVRVPPEVLERLQELKATSGKSLNRLVVELLEEGLDHRMGKAEAAA